MGVLDHQVITYESAIKVDKHLLLVHGSVQAQAQARARARARARAKGVPAGIKGLVTA